MPTNHAPLTGALAGGEMAGCIQAALDEPQQTASSFALVIPDWTPGLLRRVAVEVLEMLE